jgi:predicted amino acid racemase
MQPSLEIDLHKLAGNARIVTDICARHGIGVAGVVKVADGDPACADVMARSGCVSIASSRLEHLERLRSLYPDLPLLMLRVPMISEADRLVRACDMSLQSDIGALRAADEAASRAGVIHEVVLMVELGDLREGIWDAGELADVAAEVEGDLTHLRLAGTGTNLGCYGSIVPTAEKMEELVAATERVEAAIGRRLDLVSGGGTTSLPLVSSGGMPGRVNHLRVGEGIIVNKDMEDLYGYRQEGMHRDVLTLRAEVIEARVKPSHPIGEIAYDAFRNRPVYEDRGDRRRALLGLGKVDYGYPDQLFPRRKGVEILGASSDHTILDVEEADPPVETGDVLEFDVAYGAAALLAGARGVAVIYV